ncbi:MAG: DNA polymerase III subunit chi [Gammaproteobacteria bacterium]|jgi:DNA polymerase-3 subunit chi|nr:DNA polymerase III subunit chi [Gammaproteobacteria bacterium]|tara:strand:+ start:553 stop:993 length:441 start_codon:yes stop_codon:yes gene_type:complete
MTRIDFYQIDSDEAPLLFACRLIEKVYRKGLKVYIHTMSERQSIELDDLLWSFRGDRFIPHALENAAEEAPIKIGHNVEPDEHQEVLINLSREVPDFFSRFDRVAEIVPLGDENRHSARQNYRFYKDRGYSLQYHEIKQPAKPQNV